MGEPAGALVCGLAAHALWRLWSEGSLFARPRAYAQAHEGLAWWAGPLGCELCFTAQAACWLSGWWWLGAAVCPSPLLLGLWRLPAAALAAAGAAQAAGSCFRKHGPASRPEAAYVQAQEGPQEQARAEGGHGPGRGEGAG